MDCDTEKDIKKKKRERGGGKKLCLGTRQRTTDE